jgi:hypothetical protein
LFLGWLGCVMFVGLGFLFVIMPDFVAKLAGLVAICFFGSGIITIPLRAFRSDQYIEITDEGIIDHRTALGLIPWKDIRELRVEERYSAQGGLRSRILCMELTDPAAYIARLSILARISIKVNSSMGYPPIILSASTLTSSLEDIANYIKSKHPEKFR